MRRHILKISQVVLIGLFVYILILMGGFFGVKYGLTNTAGVVDDKSVYFQNINTEISQIKKTENEKPLAVEESANRMRQINLCQIQVIGARYPVNAKKIVESYSKNGNDALALKMIGAVDLRLLKDVDFQDKFNHCKVDYEPNLSLADLEKEFADASGPNVFPWIDRPEWQTIAAATLKDSGSIAKAGQVADIEPRLIVASMIVEQLRLFNSEREVFKKFFEPLKILGNSNKISLGIMGIKEATAERIRANLKDQASSYYLGTDHAVALDFLSGSVYDQLTDESNNHYNSYLYGALYLKQFIVQWQRAGYGIEYRPEILGTLFNVGFPQSKPNSAPRVGGSVIDVGEGQYSFGSLVYEFYYSGELTDNFPYVIK